MKYFDYLNENERKIIFYKEPKEFNKDIEKNILQYTLGGLIYVPAIRKDMIYKCINREIKGITSFAICLEDAIGVLGEEESIENLREILSYIRDNKEKNYPLIFIRPKNISQMKKFTYLLQENKDLISGIIIPKATGVKIRNFIDILDNKDCSNLYIMPIIESVEFIDYNLKHEYLMDLQQTVKEYRQRILNIRIGVTDILGSYGIRRDKDLTIYDNIAFKNFTSDLMSVIRCEEIDIPISGGVSEVYDMSNLDILKKYIKEVKIDKLNGFIGKTVIHPLQMNVVQAMNAIAYEDYMDAKSIIDGIGSKYSISSSINCERMNEVNPHTRWAKKIMVLSKIYGVLNKGIKVDELFRF